MQYCGGLEKNNGIKNFFFNNLFDIRCPAKNYFQL
jgi:hypothetical protein